MMYREKLYVKDDVCDDSYDGYTDDSDDDGRFDTIDNYLVEEIEWTNIIEEDDLYNSKFHKRIYRKFARCTNVY